MARRLNSPTLIAGRHLFQAEAEDKIADDIVVKLQLEENHSLLDIGCGVGILLSRLSKYVKEAVGVDHSAMIDRYGQMGVPDNVNLAAGEWPEVDLGRQFDRILVYSVLHYLSDEIAGQRFVKACLSHLAPGGMVLLGDIPNEDARRRWQASPESASVDGQYRQQRERERGDEAEQRERIYKQIDSIKPYLSDAWVLKLLSNMRENGYDSYVLPQPVELPFSRSREDVLIWRR